MTGHTITRERHLSATETAKIIRKALKTTFPATKFSVTTRRGTGSINVSWTDGPTRDRVEAIACQYQGGGFDGMIDLQYNISGWMLNGEIVGTRCSGTVGSRGTVSPWGMIAPHDDCELVSFGAGYIFCERAISPALANRCVAQIAEYWGDVVVVPVAVPSYSGYKLEPELSGAPIRADMYGGLHYTWGAMIYRAANDRTEFTRATVEGR